MTRTRSSFRRAVTVPPLLLAVAVMVAAAAGARAASKVQLSVPAVGVPITLDGSDQDWQGQPMTYLEESVRVLGAVHDATNLYVMFRFADETLARRISRFGVTLWLNARDRKATSYGIRFAGSGTVPEPPPGEIESHSGSQTPQGFARPGQPAAERPRGFGPPDAAAAGPPPGQLAIVRGEVTDLQPAGAPDGPAAASATIEGLTCYELRIPIADIPGLALPASPAEARTVALGIQIGGPQLGRDGSLRGSADGPDGGTGGPDGGGAAPGGMGGPGGGFGGGMGGHGGGMGRSGGGVGARGGPGGRQPVAKPVWVELQLAPAPTAP